MKKLKSIALGVIVFTQTAKSQNNFHRYYLEGQAGTGIHQNTFTGGLGGAFGFFVYNNQSVDLRAREIYNFHDQNITGAISVTYRYHLTNGLFFGGGFAHHHQIIWSILPSLPWEHIKVLRIEADWLPK